MSHGNNRLGLLPGGEALEVHAAVLRDKIVNVCTGIGDDGAVRKGGQNAGLQVPLLVREGGGAADEALAALGEIRAEHEVKLSARAADRLRSGGLSVHLTKEIEVDGVVDGNEVVELGNYAHVVRIVDGSGHELGIVVHVIVHFLRARTEGVHLAETVMALARAGDLTRLRNIHESVDVHLRVHAEILEIGLCNEGADGVGHTADAELQAGPVRDLLNNQTRNSLVDLRSRSAAAHLGDRRILALYDTRHLRDVDPVLRAAKAARHIGVDLDINLRRTLAHGAHVGSAGTEVEEAVLVHRSHLEIGDVDRADVLTVIAGQFRIADRSIESQAGIDGMALNAGHVPGIPGKMLLRLRHLEDLRRAHQNTAAEIDVLQFSDAGGKRLIDCLRRGNTPAVVHPIARFDNRRSFRGRNQLVLIFLCKTHRKCPFQINKIPVPAGKRLRLSGKTA